MVTALSKSITKSLKAHGYQNKADKVKGFSYRMYQLEKNKAP